jgi:hypothetical protein
MLLGVVPLRAGQSVKIEYDGENGKITNDATANQYRSREPRKSWPI